MNRHNLKLCLFGVLSLLALAVIIVGCAQTGFDAVRAPAAPRQAYSALASQSTGARGRTGTAVAAVEMPEGTMPSLDEEIWVIERPPADAKPDPDAPKTGALMAKLPGTQKDVPVPLKHTDVKASVAAYIATVDVTQKFHNPYDQKIEAVYLFPLPHNAAVNEFVMTIGERRIRGIIRERQEAQKIYEEAKRQGYVASLLTQERPNIFTQKVANIEPGREIDVSIRYFHTLTYADGWYEFEFPMVIGPRYNPAGSTQGVGAVGRAAAGKSGQATEVQYLKPGERSGHDVSLSVKVDAGVSIEEIASPTHAVSAKHESPGVATVSLSANDAIPNKDFVLRWRVAGDVVKSAMLVHRDAKGGYFTLMLVPPADMRALDRKPMELVFVLDCSGSMNGWPISKAKAAAERALKRLGPDDTFQIIRFSMAASQLGPAPVPATPANVASGLAYLRGLEGQGGTEMIQGIRAALDFPHDPRRLRVVSFMTDGYIGNESDILRAIHDKLGASRIFSFGVGTSVNRYLIEHMAKIGRGAVAYVGANSSSDRAVDQFYNRVSHPAMTDINVDWGAMQVSDVFPRQIPDLFVGRPVIITGIFKGAGATTVRIHGKVGDQFREIAQNVNLSDPAAAHPGIACVWARQKIADYCDESIWSSDQDLPDKIKAIALEYGLLSPYTAFLAVDSTRRTDGGHGTTVVVPVPVPAGVRYDTTVQE